MRTIVGIALGLLLVGVGSFIMATGYDTRTNPYPNVNISTIERK
jgi:hypothetical protein